MMSELYFAVARDKVSGEVVNVGVASSEAAAVRRTMVAVASNPEVQAFPDDFEYTVDRLALDGPWLSAGEFGKLMEVNHGA